MCSSDINKEELLEEGFFESDLSEMKDWDECIENPIDEGFIQEVKLLTSVSYNFVKFGVQYARMLGLEIFLKNFGL